MGRKKAYGTPAALRRGVQEYLDRISYKQDVIVLRPVITEKEGRPIVDKVPEYLYDDEGRPMQETVWLEEPSIEGLCVSLGISDTTWTSYSKDERLGPVTEEAKGLFKARLVQLLNTRNSTHGIEFNLKNNYGYREKLDVESKEDSTVRFELAPELGEIAQ